MLRELEARRSGHNSVAQMEETREAQMRYTEYEPVD